MSLCSLSLPFVHSSLVLFKGDCYHETTAAKKTAITEDMKVRNGNTLDYSVAYSMKGINFRFLLVSFQQKDKHWQEKRQYHVEKGNMCVFCVDTKRDIVKCTMQMVCLESLFFEKKRQLHTHSPLFSYSLLLHCQRSNCITTLSKRLK